MITGISNFRRLPRLGKIKLGRKDEKKKGAPVQTRYFVCPEEIQAIYGPEPTELDIMFPLDDTEIIFPQYYKKYGKTGLLCKGDGKVATCMKEGQLVEVTCTPNASECAGCKPIGVLNVLLPKIQGFGVWQIWTSSWNSIVNLNSSIDMIRAMTGGKISFIPLKLIYQEHNAVVRTSKGQFQKEVYVMSININMTMEEFYNKNSLDMKMQRGIQENEGFAAMIDATSKMKALNAGKKQERKEGPFQLEDDDEEFMEYGESEELPKQEEITKIPTKVDILTEQQLKYIDRLVKQKRVDEASLKNYSNEMFKKEHVSDLSKKEASELIEVLKAIRNEEN